MMIDDAARVAQLEAENAALRAERDEALEQQTALGAVLRVIASSPSDEQRLFDAIAEAALPLSHAGSVVIARRRPRDGQLVVCAIVGWNASDIKERFGPDFFDRLP